MGGKTKQRTKNNARPSSSGRSAELLGGGGAAGAGGLALFPTLAAPAPDPRLSPEMQLCLKKLNKKDPITKTKALLELLELVGNSKVDEVVVALPVWAHFYKILTVDPDRKVRECTQICHGRIMSLCGRRAAPQLRALLPAWLAAQCDEHAPAAAAAAASLTNTFPDSKLPDVLSFCKEEILTNQLDILISNGEMPHIKKLESAEERGAAAARALSGALCGLQLAAARLPAALDDWLWERLQPALTRPAFWKPAVDVNTRAAWYGCVGALARRYGAAWGVAHGAAVLPALMRREPQPRAAAALWPALLLHMRHVPDWYDYLEKKELLGERIFEVLKTGGWGDAKNLSEMLLPLLGALPDALLTDDFLQAFFHAMLSGLEQKSVVNSIRERQAWVDSLEECVRYVSLRGAAHAVLCGVLRAWLLRALRVASLTRLTAAATAKLIKFWIKRDGCELLVRAAWETVGVALEEAESEEAEGEKGVAETQALLLRTLRTALTETRRVRNIKFADEIDTQSSERVSPTEEVDESVSAPYLHSLTQVWAGLCARHLGVERGAELLALTAPPAPVGLWSALAAKRERRDVLELYEAELRPWLASDRRSPALVEVVFLMLDSLPEPDQDAVYRSFDQFPPAVTEWCMCAALAHPHVSRAPARRWLRGATTAAAVRALAARATRPDAGAAAAPAQALLLRCLDTDHEGENLVSIEAVETAMQTVRAALEAAVAGAGAADGAARLESLARLAAQLAHVQAPHEDLAHALLQLSAALQCGEGGLSADTWHEARDAWRDACAALPAPRRDTLRRRALATMHGALPEGSDDEQTMPDAGPDVAADRAAVDVSRIEHCASLCGLLLVRGEEAHAAEAHCDAALRLPAPPHVQACATAHHVRAGTLTCPLGEPADDVTLRRSDVATYLGGALFRAAALRGPSGLRAGAPPGAAGVHVASVARDVVVLRTLHQGYTFWPHYKMITKSKKRLETLLDDIIRECSEKERTEISVLLVKMATTEGYLWAHAAEYYDARAREIAAEPPVEKEGEGDSDPRDEASETEPTEREDGENPHDVTSAALTEGVSERKESAETQSSETTDLDGARLVERLGDSGEPTMMYLLHYMEARWLARGESARAAYCAGAAALHCAAEREAAAALRREVAQAAADLARMDDVFVNLYYHHNDTMLYERCLQSASWAAATGNARVCDFLRARITQHGAALAAQVWDFANISLCSLLTSAELSKDHWHTAKVALVSRAALQLFCAARDFVSQVPAAGEREQLTPHVAALPREWNDIYAPDANRNLFTLVAHVLESCESDPVGSKTMSGAELSVIDALVNALRRARWDAVAETHRARGSPLCALRLAAVAAAALRSLAHAARKQLAYCLLLALQDPLVLHDAETLAECGGEAERLPALALSLLVPPLLALQELVDTLLGAQDGATLCRLAPHCDAHALALGYLLLADAINAQCERARAALRHHYLQLYRGAGVAETLLRAAVRLLPDAAVAEAGAAPPHLSALFVEPPRIDVYEWCGSGALSGLAARALSWCVRGAGAAAARSWRGAAPPTQAALLDRITARFITPTVVREELTRLQRRSSEIEDAEVSINWSSYEVTCALAVEDNRITLTVSLSRSHPLLLPALTTGHAAAGNVNWIGVYLGYQSGTLLSALQMWAESCSRRIERAPQCYICYCRLHHASGKLPQAYCHTCQNKFHSLCLRKWFMSSSKMTCPLCRAAF